MAAPGVTIQISELRAPASAPTDTGTAFMVGMTDRGPLSPVAMSYRSALELHSLTEFERYYGTRQSYSRLHDAARAFFLEGGTKLFIGRVVGTTPVTATVNLSDNAAATSLVVKAKSPGAWANGPTGLGIDVDAGVTTGTFILKVYLNSVLVEQSPELVDQAAAVDWATYKSSYVDITIGASALDPAPTGSATNLASGADDRASITTSHVQTALDGLVKSLGPGQVLAPDWTTDAINQALLAHASSRNRVALISGASTATSAALISSAGTVGGGTNGRYGALFAPWAKYTPPSGASTPVDVPWAAIQAGMIAKVDRRETPAQAAAGDTGQASSNVQALSSTFTDTELSDLNGAGVTVARNVNGRFQTYGLRSLASSTDENWLQFPGVREIMYLAAKAEAIGQHYMFRRITRAGALSHLEGDLIALCMEEFRRGALFPDPTGNPASAFFVDASSTAVNSDADLATGNVKAHIEARVVPGAEFVTIELVKVSPAVSLAA